MLRFNLAELDVVRNLSGETNIVTMLAKMPKGNLAPKGIRVSGRKFEFETIDVLNLSLGRARFIDLKNHDHDREVLINMDNQVFNNVKTDGDLEKIADQLADMDEIDYVVISAGSFDVLAEVVCEDDDHLLEILSRVRSVPCVTSTETFVYLKLRKQTYSWGTR